MAIGALALEQLAHKGIGHLTEEVV
jgi:hypothetical protein